MPPKTSPKKKKLSDDEAKKVIADYMQRANRPYNDKMVFENLHGVVGKKQTTTCMDELVTDDMLCVKTFGKSNVYWINQKVFPETSAAEMKALQDQVKQLEQSAASKRGELRALSSENAAAARELSGDELAARLVALERRTAAAATQLESDGGVQVSRGDMERVEAQLQRALGAWRQRKKLADEMLADLAEGSGKPTKELRKLLELEDDADAGVTLPAPTKRAPPPSAVSRKKQRVQ